jgi:hypothetical protein
MVTRREMLGVTAAAITGSAAGCSAVPFLGDDPIEFEASRAAIPGSVRDDTGYEEHDVSESVVERTFEAGGETQDIVVTNWQAEYDRAVDPSEAGLPIEERVRAAIFTVLSTPQVSVLGRSFNPVGDRDSAELAEMVQDRYDGVEDVEQVGEDPALVAGRETTAGEFLTQAELTEAGVTVELTLHITEAVEVGEDFLVTVGSYPRRVQDAEEDNVFTMMESVEHQG